MAKVCEEDQVHALLNGVDRDYDPVHATVSCKRESVSGRCKQCFSLMKRAGKAQ